MNVHDLKLRELKNKNICVIGDMIVDHSRILNPKKLSPEAPVVIFEEEFEEYRAGGAGNVAVNLMALGVNTSLVSVCGNDGILDFVRDQLPTNTVILKESGRITTVKERIITRRQQICRIDSQSNAPINKSIKDFIECARLKIVNSDAIVFSDYAHGVCVEEAIVNLIEFATSKKIPIIVDSKAKDTLTKYRGSTVALPNMDEARLMTKLDDFEDEDVAKFLLKTMKLKIAAITLGPRGILLAQESGTKIYPPLHPNINNEVIDVTGAGDTVAATVACGIALGMSYGQIMTLANVTAGIKVQKRGVAAVMPDEITETMMLHHIDLGE